MNGAQLHLAFNHLPVVGTLFAVIVLLVGVILKNASVIRTGLGLGVLAAVLSIPAFLSGEPAQEVLKQWNALPKEITHEHEEFAEASFAVLLAAGALSAGALGASFRFVRFERLTRWAALVALVISVGMMAWAAHLGGLIRHEELRGNPPTQQM